MDLIDRVEAAACFSPAPFPSSLDVATVWLGALFVCTVYVVPACVVVFLRLFNTLQKWCLTMHPATSAHTSLHPGAVDRLSIPFVDEMAEAWGGAAGGLGGLPRSHNCVQMAGGTASWASCLWGGTLCYRAALGPA